MYADIEALVLSGELFNGGERSSSPVRSESPSSDKGWHDEELVNNEQQPNTADVPTHDSIGMGPGRTGVKGVIRDRDEALEIERAKRNREINETNERMMKANLGGKTYLEEEREKGSDEKVDPIVQQEREKATTRLDVWGDKKRGKFGHLREVGVQGFVGAVEKEDIGTWVVVHLYEKYLDRCYTLDDTLTRLARAFPDTKFLRCKASALGFAVAQSSAPKKSIISRVSKRSNDDEDDPYGDGHSEKGDSSDEDDTVDVDLDVLPTMLVYRSGELLYNWVRVDWEAGQAGIEELLSRHHIIPPRNSIFSSLGIPSDDDDDSDDDFDWQEPNSDDDKS